MRTRTLLTGLVAVALAAGSTSPLAQVHLGSASDRAALRAWFVLLADAQFYRPTPDVTDCAALIRHALREALRPHTPEWVRLARLPLPLLAPAPDAQQVGGADAWRMFLVSTDPRRYAEFADARTIVRLNAAPLGRDLRATRPGDLLYFRQRGGGMPDHVMVYVGASALTPEASDWLVYHTGPGSSGTLGQGAGEVRKVRLADLARHPSPRWRPTSENPSFVGVFRLHLLS